MRLFLPGVHACRQYGYADPPISPSRFQVTPQAQPLTHSHPMGLGQGHATVMPLSNQEHGPWAGACDVCCVGFMRSLRDLDVHVPIFVMWLSPMD